MDAGFIGQMAQCRNCGGNFLMVAYEEQISAAPNKAHVAQQPVNSAGRQTGFAASPAASQTAAGAVVNQAITQPGAQASAPRPAPVPQPPAASQGAAASHAAAQHTIAHSMGRAAAETATPPQNGYAEAASRVEAPDITIMPMEIAARSVPANFPNQGYQQVSPSPAGSFPPYSTSASAAPPVQTSSDYSQPAAGFSAAQAPVSQPAAPASPANVFSGATNRSVENYGTALNTEVPSSPAAGETASPYRPGNNPESRPAPPSPQPAVPNDKGMVEEIDIVIEEDLPPEPPQFEIDENGMLVLPSREELDEDIPLPPPFALDDQQYGLASTLGLSSAEVPPPPPLSFDDNESVPAGKNENEIPLPPLPFDITEYVTASTGNGEERADASPESVHHDVEPPSSPANERAVVSNQPKQAGGPPAPFIFDMPADFQVGPQFDFGDEFSDETQPNQLVVCPKCKYSAEIPPVKASIRLRCQQCGKSFFVKPPRRKRKSPLSPTAIAGIVFLLLVLGSLTLGPIFFPDIFADLLPF